ncbi:DUF5681 domain-containing protein [Taklimakanibacter lacteus]|uniref:DUF5681 domain-containing protein n=1 Tax=Taklimakanibacter lacteus TaxID=2268456 RepID=UPI000E67608A
MNDKCSTEPAIEPKRGGYDVGYGRAPKDNRFVKGQSGNPGGKPKGTRNKLPALHERRLKDLIMEEAYRQIVIHENGTPMTVSMVQATLRAVAVAAVKGKFHAQTLLLRLVSAVEDQNQELHEEFLDSMIDYKTQWEKELARRKANGLELPDPVPHPDDIQIDMQEGTVRMLGAWTKEEKAVLDEWQAEQERSKPKEAIS